MDDETFMTLMRLLPRSAVSSAVGALARARLPAPVHRLLMRGFAAAYGVDLAQAEHGLEGYATFADFFSRRLKPDLRPVSPGEKVVVAPVDGLLSQLGYAQGGLCVQAKGIEYPVDKLLADELAARRFSAGAFATLYLSPRDYHRIHAPLGGRVVGYSYLPGEFWPVNARSVRSLEALFCVNERLVTYVETAAGVMAVVAVGATCVSRIRASYDESIVTHRREPAKVHRYEAPLPVDKGAELGRFEMGSTVVLLFESGRVKWDEGVVPESKVRMGQRLGEVL
jgi:phosphatidylserine decarboxylase